MSYSRQESVERAMTVFWQKGYVGTGMRDIQAALDKRPGSIYATFGNKEGLYLAALTAYTQSIVDTLQACSQADNPLRALKTFMRSPLLKSEAETYMRQCLIVKTQADWLELPAGIQTSLRDALNSLRSGFEAVVLAAQQRGELSAEMTPEQAALWLQGQFIALRTLATATDDASTLAWILDKVFNDLQRQ
ncbi:TetR/AcrR family transcriptional regulator [Alteromonas gilva]|uniref:TetR/AcrR family transcriptional regulator n=1 Tax=Alteromonas gilva TaxID=2987522 RepID=A0ABT5L0K7_9ALTE|nr:TetR/AcrR family transcriptional regulator [Alteromonas gilva]MDC8830550.1 TetR/AcrR family transcriptional regulator [Alteromonas gilva]